MITVASFDSMYSTWVEQLLGKPEAKITLMEGFTSIGEKVTMTVNGSGPDFTVQAWATVDAVMTRDDKLQWDVDLQLSVTAEWETMTAAWSMQMRGIDDMLYVQANIDTLDIGETIDAQTQLMINALKNQWISIPTDTAPELKEMFSFTQSMQMSKDMVDVLKKNPIVKSTKQLSRNGYEIHLLQADMNAMNTLATEMMQVLVHDQADMVAMDMMGTDLDTGSWKTIGVIGQKWSEIKMGMTMKDTITKDSFQMISNSDDTQSTIIMKGFEWNNKKAIMEFHLQNTTKSPTESEIKAKIMIPDEQIEFNISATSNVYDAGTIQIVAPDNALSIEEITSKLQ